MSCLKAVALITFSKLPCDRLRLTNPGLDPRVPTEIDGLLFRA
jgi:hypothetical protein